MLYKIRLILTFLYGILIIGLKTEDCNKLKNFVKIEITYTYSIIRIERFSKFDMLEFSCFKSVFQPIGLLQFIPNNKVSFDNSLNLNINSSFILDYVKFYFALIDNFMPCINIFNDFISNDKKIYLFFSYSTLKLNNKDKCAQNNSNSTFKKLIKLSFLNSCKYNSLTDPKIFQNSLIEWLEIAGLTDTIIRRNILEFKQIEHELNSVIEFVQFNFYRSNLENKLLDYEIFKNIKFLLIKGRIELISENVFLNFSNLREIDLQSSNNLYFLKNGIKFLNSLNIKDKINTTKSLENVTIRFKILDYNFPNEDFCLFKEFPKNKFILTVPDKNWMNCSCLFFWLMDMYFYNYGKKIIKENLFCINEYKSGMCDFHRQCQKIITIKDEKNHIDYFFLSEIYNFITVFLIPIFCLFGIFSNLLNMIVVKKLKFNHKNDSKIDLTIYEWIQINSFINLLYSFIYLFHLANMCIFVNGIYCPSLSRSILIQYYEIFFIDYLGGILKIFSNFINVLISFERFSSLKGKVLKIFKRKKCILFLILIIGIAINFEKPITSEIKRFDFQEVYGNSYPEYPLRNTFKGVWDKDFPHQDRTLKFKFKNSFYYGLFLFNFMTNDVILFLLFLFVDLLLLLEFKRKINEKLKIMSRIFYNKNEKLFRINMKNLRFTAVILVNTNTLLIFRMLEFIMNLLVFIQSKNENLCSSISKACTNYYHFGNFFYLITSSFMIFVNYFFYKKFRNVMRNLFL